MIASISCGKTRDVASCTERTVKSTLTGHMDSVTRCSVNEGVIHNVILITQSDYLPIWSTVIHHSTQRATSSPVLGDEFPNEQHSGTTPLDGSVQGTPASQTKYVDRS